MKPNYLSREEIYDLDTLIDSPPIGDDETNESFEDDVWFCETEQGTRLDL